MSHYVSNEAEGFSVVRTLDLSGPQNGEQEDSMNVGDALDVNTEKRAADHQHFEESIEERGDGKHVISQAENGEHLTATSLGLDDFQKLLLLAEEFEVGEGAKIREGVEATCKMEGANGEKEDSIGKDLWDSKAKGGK